MYCLKCGNLLKKEDNFCSICGTPNNAEAKRIRQGASGYGHVRDDEPINLDDFFKTDEKKEQTFAKMDRELEDIKTKATENLLRRKNGDASARRAARLARKTASEVSKRDKKAYGANSELDFNDEVFQKSREGSALVGRRGQLKNKTAGDWAPDITEQELFSGEEKTQVHREDKKQMTLPPKEQKPASVHEEAGQDFYSEVAESFKKERAEYWKEHDATRYEYPDRLKSADQEDMPVMDKTQKKKPAKHKKHHLFREDTIEMPNIFDEIAQSMEKSRQEERVLASSSDRDNDDDTPLTWRPIDSGSSKNAFSAPHKDIFAKGTFSLPPKEDMTEGVFPLPPKKDMTEGVFPLPPKEDMAEGVFPLPPKEDMAEGVFPLPPKEDMTEGVFPLPPKEDMAEGVFPLPPKEDMTEGVFPLPPKEDMTEGVFPLPPKEDMTEGVFPLPPKEDMTEGVFPLPPKEDMTEGVFPLPPKEDMAGGVFPLPHKASKNADDGDKEIKEPEYEYFRYRSKKKKDINPALVAAAVVIIIISAVGVKMLYDGETPASVFHQLQNVFAADEDKNAIDMESDSDDTIQDISETENDVDISPPDISELKEQGASDPAKMLQYVLSKGISQNIKSIQYNPELKYVAGTKYKSDDIINSNPITENVFYEKGGEKYYYTESIISTIVQYNSQWVDYFNNQDKAVLDLIKKGSKAYQDAVKFSSDGANEEFVLLEIGEMRKGEQGYYIWTRETYNITKGSTSKSEESQWIYYLEPSGESMKIVSYYNY